MQTPVVQSPPFGYLSPPIDGCDACSEDGDALQTPQTEHEPHQPYAVYHQNQHHFSHGLFNTEENHQGSVKFEPTHTTFSALLTPSATDKLRLVRAPGDFLEFSPPQALDLANASLEFNPFAASFAATFDGAAGIDPQVFAQDASAYDDTQDSFEFSPSTTTADDSFNTSSDTTDIPSLPSFSVSSDPHDSFDISGEMTELLEPLLLAPTSPSRPCAVRSPASENLLQTKGRLYSPRFPADHTLSPFFIGTYELGDELGAGGYGFVMTARHRMEGYEVAVKFIIKDKVPAHAWWDDELLGHVPTEVMIMTLVDHENIVKCVDLFEDELYFYLVQELHGTPWVSRKNKSKQVSAPGKLVAPSPSSTPSLTPSPSTDTDMSLPATPLVSVQAASPTLAEDTQGLNLDALAVPSVPEGSSKDSENTQSHLQPPTARPNFSRRPSYDLFECIEQSKHKRLSESNARYVFAQVVEAVYYLNSQGITHCDIKDENLVVDSEFRVKLIDFGSAVVADPNAPAPYYTLFYGTTAYASSEILQKQPYQAAPAEVWTLGVLLSYLLTGHSPFPTEKDAIDGRIVMRERGNAARPSRAALNLLARCLERDPKRRATIDDVRNHRWLQGALEREE